jgi:hypothetical protein
MTYEFNNRQVEIAETDVGDGTMMVIGAYYVDTDVELTEDELLAFEEAYSEALQEMYFEYQVCRAEYAFEGDR